MTIQHLVPLLAAYEQAIGAQDAGRRRVLAGVVCQGISADPDLYVHRVDLLGAYSMIEPVFTTCDGDGVALSPTGHRHLQLVRQYVALVRRLAGALLEDYPHSGRGRRIFAVRRVFGFSSTSWSTWRSRPCSPDRVTVSLEDVFADEGPGAQRLPGSVAGAGAARATDVVKLYEYHIRRESSRASGRHCTTPSSPRDPTEIACGCPEIAGCCAHVLSTDPRIVSAERRTRELPRLLADRQEACTWSATRHGRRVAISRMCSPRRLARAVTEPRGLPAQTARSRPEYRIGRI